MQRTLQHISSNYRFQTISASHIETSARFEDDTLVFNHYKRSMTEIAGVMLGIDWDGYSELSLTFQYPRSFSDIQAGMKKSRLDYPIVGLGVQTSLRTFDIPPQILGITDTAIDEYHDFTLPDSIGTYIANDHLDQQVLRELEQIQDSSTSHA